MLSGFEIGLCASILGSFCGTLGGQLRISSLACVGRVASCLQAWGWATWLLGQCLGQVAILFAPATVAACVTFSASLLSNALLAPLVLGETLTAMHGLGIALLSLGGTAVTWASSHGGGDVDSWASLRALPEQRDSIAAVGSVYLVALLLLARGAKHRHLDLLSFAYLFALCGSTDLLVTKFTLQLCRLQVIVDDPADLPSRPVVGACVALMMLMHVGTFGFQVASVYFRKALQSLPLFLGSGAIMQISLCGVFFRELNFDTRQAVAFGAGLCLVILGLVVTSMAAPSHTEEEEDVEEEDKFEQPSDDLMNLVSQVSEAVTSPRSYKLRSSAAGTPRSVSIDAGADNMPEQSRVERSSSTLSSADLLLVAEMQRGAVCFGGRRAREVRGDVRFGSWEPLRRPLLRSLSSPMSTPNLRAGECGANGMFGLARAPRANSHQVGLFNSEQPKPSDEFFGASKGPF
mmetsp:Transcript_22865/g.64239  ORF Transcript_22865/g.64239 Transcript_22865/m.64239 type:complete len:462 (-) Transcript_22865:82-1467(-)